MTPEQAVAAIKRIAAIHQPEDNPAAPEDRLEDEAAFYCSECYEWDSDRVVWPCPTLQALKLTADEITALVGA